MKRRRGRALRRRYGRAISGPQLITQPSRGSHTHVDVIEVDNRGTVLRTVKRGIPYSLARVIISKRHG